jgi:hypothetical protein
MSFLIHDFRGLEIAPGSPPRAEPRSVAPSQQLSSDDFLLRINTFRKWLYESKKLLLDDIASDEARALFDDFVELWNDGDLPADFYSVAEESAWAGLNAGWIQRDTTLSAIRDEVRAMTWGRGRGGPPPSVTPASHSAHASAPVPRREPRVEEDPADAEERVRVEQLARKAAEQRMRRDRELVMEELVPKETGRSVLLFLFRVCGDLIGGVTTQTVRRCCRSERRRGLMRTRAVREAPTPRPTWAAPPTSAQ